MFLKRIAAVLCAFALAFSLTACSAIDTNVEDMITPPLQDGDIYDIQKALEASVGNKIILKYPISGDYRAAFSFMDIDGDGVEEALALYSVNNDGTVSMHLNIIDNIEDEWVSRSDIKVVGNGVEKLAFSDLNDDKVPEIIVGWMIYGTVDKQVGVYTYDGTALNQRAMEKYTDFLCASLKQGGNEELIVIDLNTTDKTSSVKVLSLNDTGIVESGSAMLDGGVTSYSAPIVSTLSDGRPALFLDAIKGTGTLTEIIWFDDNTLKSTYDPLLAETNLTFRPSAVYLRDIDGNGDYEIPVMSILKSTEQKPEVDKVYVTSWSSFNGKKLVTEMNTFMNYTDGYYLSIPAKWMNKLHLARKTDSKQRIFYSYDPKTDTQGDELFRIVAVEGAVQRENTDEYFELGKYNEITYFAKVVENNDLSITEEQLKENFFIIK